jgi:hypothetical protein
MPEVDLVIDNRLAPISVSPEDQIPVPKTQDNPVSQIGDMWFLNEHRVLSGDAREEASYRRLLGTRLAQQAITDAPYNVPIQGHVRVTGPAQPPCSCDWFGKISTPWVLMSSTVTRVKTAQWPKWGYSCTSRPPG